MVWTLTFFCASEITWLLLTPGKSSIAREMRCTFSSVFWLKMVPSLTSTETSTLLAPPKMSLNSVNVST
jgi:hypothetical protein